MKPNPADTPARYEELKLMSVRFEFTHPTAGSVCVAGTFNDWHPTTKAMYSDGDGHWLKEAFLLPGSYEYRLVVDGHWMADPLVKDQVTNAFGGRNSVVKVARPPAAAHRADAQNLPLKSTNKMNPQKL
jgi:1,4-alpha-glucan branching enzyme